MENRNKLSEVVPLLLADYQATFQIIPSRAIYRFVTDMSLEYSKIRPDHAMKYPNIVVGVNKFNGTIVPPYSVDEDFTVLINIAKLLEYSESNHKDRTWVGTIIHETTHVGDFKEYAHIIGASDYEELFTTNKHLLFNNWTECNARAKGYYFVRKYTVDDLFDYDQIDNIINYELPKQEDLLYRNYHSTNNAVLQTYYVAQYIGRLYTLQQLFPLYFTNQRIKQILPNDWMYQWYIFFHDHQDLRKAYEDFSYFRDILNSNFTGF